MSHGIVHYVHGYGAGPIGYKSVQLKEIILKAGWDYEALDYQFTDDAAERARFLIAHLQKSKQPVVLVGSSMGGWVAAETATKYAVHGLFLLCPAFELDRYPSAHPAVKLPSSHIEIVHGMHDDVVPLDASMRAAKAWDCALHVLADNHVLHKSTPVIGELLNNYLARICVKQVTVDHRLSSDRHHWKWTRKPERTEHGWLFMNDHFSIVLMQKLESDSDFRPKGEPVGRRLYLGHSAKVPDDATAYAGIILRADGMRVADVTLSVNDDNGDIVALHDLRTAINDHTLKLKIAASLIADKHLPLLLVALEGDDDQFWTEQGARHVGLENDAIIEWHQLTHRRSPWFG